MAHEIITLDCELTVNLPGDREISWLTERLAMEQLKKLFQLRASALARSSNSQNGPWIECTKRSAD